jgi:hypothetical protein
MKRVIVCVLCFGMFGPLTAHQDRPLTRVSEAAMRFFYRATLLCHMCWMGTEFLRT